MDGEDVVRPRPRYRLLGGTSATVGTEPVDLGGPKQRAVLALLALDAGRVVPVDRLIALLWGDRPPPSAEVSLRSYISNLRRALEPDRRPGAPPTTIVSRRPGYLLVAAVDELDVTRFEGLVARGHERLEAGDAQGASDLLDEALGMWSGPPLADVAGELPRLEAVQRLVERRSEAVELRFEARLRLGDHRRCLPELAAAVAEQPLRERLREHLAIALYRCGRQVDALRAIDDARRTLVEEVGVAPGPGLKRLEAAILAHDPSLAWPEGGDGGRGGAPGPGPTRGGAGEALVGRDAELSALDDALTAVLGGASRCVVVSGEPGIGKTALLRELLARAAAAGAAVAWARCPETASAAPYWPWLQLAEQLAVDDVVQGLADALRPGAGSGDLGTDRVRQHLAAVQSLTRATRPIVLVVDDLQWADVASLQLLELATGEVGAHPVLLAVATRPPGPDDAVALISCLGELARAPGSARLELTGMSASDVADWVAKRDAVAARDPGVAAFLHDRTGGNPFFLRELLALLGSDRSAGGGVASPVPTVVPAAVHDVVRRRVMRLPVTTSALLPMAAVVGRRFAVDVVATVADLGTDEVLDRLEAAVAAGLVRIDDLRPGRFVFAHALVAEALAAEVNPLRRARLHAATAAAIHARRAGGADDPVEELAFHAFAGAGAGSAELAVVACRQASDLAAASLAHADAATHLTHALAAHEIARPGALEERSELLRRLGLLHAWAGDVAAAHRAMADAASVAEVRGDVSGVVATVALINVDDFWSSAEWGHHDPRTVGLLERALDRLPLDDDVGRAATMSALGLQLARTGRPQRSPALADDAIALARRSGDPMLLTRTLFQAWWSSSGLGTLARRTPLAAELVSLTESHLGQLPPRVFPLAHLAAFACALESGDGAAADAHLARAEVHAGADSGFELEAQLRWSRSCAVLLRGRFALAEQLATEMWQAFWRSRRHLADVTRAVVVAQARAERGEVDGALEALHGATGTPFEGACQWLRAWICADAGRLDAAEEALAAHQGMAMPDSWLRPVALTAGLHAAVSVGDRTLVEGLTALLRPVAPLVAIAGNGGPALGPVDLALARAEHERGDDETAMRHLDRALDQCERLAAEPWRARCLLLRADVTGTVADRAEAAAIASRLGMAPIPHGAAI